MQGMILKIKAEDLMENNMLVPDGLLHLIVPPNLRQIDHSAGTKRRMIEPFLTLKRVL
jgi:hypothetical protein